MGLRELIIFFKLWLGHYGHWNYFSVIYTQDGRILVFDKNNNFIGCDSDTDVVITPINSGSWDIKIGYETDPSSNFI